MSLRKLEDGETSHDSIRLKLQAETLTPRVEFLKVWKEVIFQFDRKEVSIAKDMVEALRVKEIDLLNNRLVIAAVVGARCRILLTPVKRETAKAALQETND